MKNPTPIETIGNAYGQPGIALAEAVILMLAQARQLNRFVRSESDGAEHLIDALSESTTAVIYTLVTTLLSREEFKPFMQVCVAECTRREELAAATLAAMNTARGTVQ